MRRRTAIGGLLLESFTGWDYHFQHGAISASHEKDPGILRIASVLQNELPQPVNHEICLDLAARMLDLPAGEVTDRQMFESVCGPYGAATFRSGEDLLRVWYCRRPPGLILGVYACPAKFRFESGYRYITGQCAHIMTTALFDRPSWGGEDEFTKAFMEHLELAEESEDDLPAPPELKPVKDRSSQKRPLR